MVVFAVQLDSLLQLADLLGTPPRVIVEASQQLGDLLVFLTHYLLAA
jgi:hypothetical protein